MTTWVKMTAISTLALAIAAGSPLAAQQAQPTPKRVPAARVSVVLERYQADKKVSSLPFSLWLTPQFQNGTQSSGSVRIGVQVPIGSTTTTRGTTSGNTTSSNVMAVPQYQDVGTQIDCHLFPTDQDGLYILAIRLSDSSIYDPNAAREAALVARGLASAKASPIPESPLFRNFTFDNSVQMHDGQTAEYVNAADKITGEIVKAIVTLNVQK